MHHLALPSYHPYLCLIQGLRFPWFTIRKKLGKWKAMVHDDLVYQMYVKTGCRRVAARTGAIATEHSHTKPSSNERYVLYDKCIYLLNGKALIRKVSDELWRKEKQTVHPFYPAYAQVHPSTSTSPHTPSGAFMARELSHGRTPTLRH
jgi:hypothetical protein